MFILPCKALQRLSLRERSPWSHAREAPGRLGERGFLAHWREFSAWEPALSALSTHPGPVRWDRGGGGGTGAPGVPVSESFCSPWAPTVKGSFRLVARSLTSFPPSLRSSFGVLVRETLSLSWERE